VFGSGNESAGQLDDAVAKLVKSVRRVEKTMVASNPPPVATAPARVAPSATPDSNVAPRPSAIVPVTTSAPLPAPATAPTVIETKAAPPAPVAAAPTAKSTSADSGQGSESLQLTSSPDGAEIYVDQNFFGNSPATLKLTGGRHNSRLTMPGYHSWYRDITAQPGSDARLTANMVKSVPGTISGRVLWNEQPMPDVQVYARECAAPSPKVGPVTTDAKGRFTLADVPDARVCVELHPANAKEYWTIAATIFEVAPGKETTAPDAYVCKLFDLSAPKAGESVNDSRPLLKWERYPDAVGYSVQVFRLAPNYVSIFRRGERDQLLDKNSLQVETDLSPGEYYWRVDAYNRAGHVIGCNYPVKFRISEGSSNQR
jgi:hypothetical protein